MSRKAYKVQDAVRKNRVGITALNFNEVIARGKEKLKILEEEKVILVLESDKTRVDDDEYFQSLPAQTVFIFLKETDKWKDDVDELCTFLMRLPDEGNKKEKAKQIRERMTKELAPEKIHIMAQCLNFLESNIEAEKRNEHKDWFEGVHKKIKSKSKYMRNCAQQRIRSYYYSAKKKIENEDSATKALLKQVLDELTKQLKTNKYHGHYFDRIAADNLRMCDGNGWFKCEGPFDKDLCSECHIINPYTSKWNRLQFQLWDLDHKIEKSRTILPILIEAAKLKQKNNMPNALNHHEVYRLLFTRSNLKLVHNVCHKQEARDSQLDIHQLFSN
ncbi:hypothetical protein BsWGS_25940 [Bradybaena similaris]